MLPQPPRILVVSLCSMLCFAAHAQNGETPALSWVRAEGAEHCPGAPAIAAALEEWMGPVLVPPNSAELSVEGLIAPHGTAESFDARVVVSRSDGSLLGERRWSVGADCSRVTRQAAFIIAVTLDPSAMELAMGEIDALFPGPDDPAAALRQELEATAASPAADSPKPLLEPSPQPHEPEPSPPEADLSTPERRALGLGLLAFFATRGEVTAGGSLQIVRDLGRLPLWVSFEGELLTPRVESVPEPGSARIRHWRANARGSLCARWPGPRAVRVSTCAGGLVGVLVSRGLGFEQDSASGSLLAGLSLAGDLESPLGPLWGYVRVGADWLARRAEASYTEPRGRDVVALRASRFAGQLTLGIRHRW